MAGGAPGLRHLPHHLAPQVVSGSVGEGGRGVCVYVCRETAGPHRTTDVFTHTYTHNTIPTETQQPAVGHAPPRGGRRAAGGAARLQGAPPRLHHARDHPVRALSALFCTPSTCLPVRSAPMPAPRPPIIPHPTLTNTPKPPPKPHQQQNRYPLPQLPEIEAHAAITQYGPELAKHWLTDLRTRVIQHNVRVLARYYKRVRLTRAAELLSLSVVEVRRIEYIRVYAYVLCMSSVGGCRLSSAAVALGGGGGCWGWGCGVGRSTEGQRVDQRKLKSTIDACTHSHNTPY